MPSILAAIHNRENSSGANAEIAAAMRELARSPNQLIAHDAALYYASLEYLPASADVLKEAWRKAAIGEDSYYHELADPIPSAPASARLALMAEIRESKNALASSVLEGHLNSGEDVSAASFLKSSDDMDQLLRATEPEFDSAVGRYGMVQALRYIDWLRATAAIESEKTGRLQDDVIVGMLSHPGTDPRKVLAYLSSPEAVPLLESSEPGSPVQQLAEVARLHARQNRPNRDMAELAQLMESRLKHPLPPLQEPSFNPPTGPLVGPRFAPEAPQSMPRR